MGGPSKGAKRQPKSRAASRRSPVRSSPVRSGQVLLLKRTPYGESSLVIHGLTASGERIELIAKGAHRPKSRFSGVLDWFDTLNLEWSPPRVPHRPAHHRPDAAAKTSDLGILRAGDLDRRRRQLTRSLEAYRAAHSALELTGLATRFGHGDQRLFRLLEGALDALDDLGAPSTPEGAHRLAAIHLTLARFELQLLAELGLAPALASCAMCGRPAPPLAAADREAPPRAAFSAGAGGRLCTPHAAEARAARLRVGTLPVSTLEAALALSQGKPLDSVLAGRDHGDLDQFALRVLDFTGRFIEYQLESRPNSQAAFLSAPDRNRRSRQQSP